MAILFAVLIYAVVHSLLAGRGVKQWFRGRLGERAYEGLYRIGYNAFAVITLLPVLALVALDSGGMIWQVEGVGQWGLLALQGLGALGLLVSLLQIDLGRFLGTRQLTAYLSGDSLPLPEEPLQTGGVYALTRHPLYLFSLLAIWSQPVMRESMLAFNIAVTLYFVFGSLIEERRLIAAFGADYLQYRQQVAWLIPGLRF